jgi:hypothetical protein
MTDHTPVEVASQRLTQALEALDAAIDSRIEIERNRPVLTEQVHALDADRSRLAAELDSQTARARRLELANRDISQRLEAAMQNIHSVLDGQEGA